MATLAGAFGLLALTLTCVGLYGLLAYSVTQRTREIGIRMALGAERAGVRWMVMREIIVLVVAGVAIGVALALAAGRLVTSMLYGLKPTEPGSLALAVIVLLSVALAAGYLPARRASRVSPMEALRYE